MADACYIPNYLRGVFKGVEFEVDEADSEHGRRGAEGEFPFGETTRYIDLGRRIRRYHVRGRFSTNDHIERAEELASACESPGPGDLSHPTRGIVVVACKSCKVSDRIREEAGVSYVDMEFVEANDWYAGGFATSLIGLDIVGIIGAVEAWFSRSYSVDPLPFYDVWPVTGLVAGLAETIEAELTRVAGVDPESEIWSIVADLRAVKTDPTAGLDPAVAWQVIGNGLAAINFYAATLAADADAMRAVSNWAASQRVTSTEAAGPQSVVIAATRIVAAAYLAKVGTKREAATLGEGLAEFDRVMTILDEEWGAAKSICDDVLMMEIESFRVTAARDLLDRAYNLPGIVVYDFGGPVSSLAAAYELYGDASRFSELETYNPDAFPWAIGPTVTASRA